MEVCIVDVLYLPVSSEDGHCVMISSCKLLGEPESVRSNAVICECFGISGGFLRAAVIFAVGGKTSTKDLGIPSMVWCQQVLCMSDWVLTHFTA